jgi:hypothetical protein
VPLLLLRALTLELFTPVSVHPPRNAAITMIETIVFISCS